MPLTAAIVVASGLALLLPAGFAQVAAVGTAGYAGPGLGSLGYPVLYGGALRGPLPMGTPAPSDAAGEHRLRSPHPYPWVDPQYRGDPGLYPPVDYGGIVWSLQWRYDGGWRWEGWAPVPYSAYRYVYVDGRWASICH